MRRSASGIRFILYTPAVVPAYYVLFPKLWVYIRNSTATARTITRTVGSATAGTIPGATAGAIPAAGSGTAGRAIILTGGRTTLTGARTILPTSGGTG
jgi:hypothetical protein